VVLFRSPAVAVGLVLAVGTALALAARAGSPSLIPPDLPAADRQLVEFLLLLPVAAFVCCVVRNLIGLHTFGTFAPALLGISFREVESAIGVFVLITVLSAGWVFRRALSRLNLLQVPRSAVMLRSGRRHGRHHGTPTPAGGPSPESCRSFPWSSSPA